MKNTLLKHPGALIPVAMSVAALSIVLGYAVMFGVARQEDEGTAAHMWQLLMAGQVPLVAFFIIKWLPDSPDRRYWFSPFKLVRRSSRCSQSGGFVGKKSESHAKN